MAKRGRPLKGSSPPETDLPELLALWNLAIESANGIAIQSANPNRLSQKLYAARRECGHQAYAGWRIVSLEEEVWILPR